MIDRISYEVTDLASYLDVKRHRIESIAAESGLSEADKQRVDMIPIHLARAQNEIDSLLWQLGC